MAISTILQAPRLIFTGLGGSLLDHHSYDWQPAVPWLQRLAQAGVSVIPVTSKTRAELLALRLDLGLKETPFIAENGAVIGLPPSWQHARLDRNPGDIGGLSIKTLGVDIDFLRWRLDVLRTRMKVHFRGMGEMTLDEIVAATELSEPAARLARVREGSEPLIWDDSDQALNAFREVLRNDGLKLTRGGRFWHVTGDVDKGRAVRWLISRFIALRGASPCTLGLGDGPNDAPLLEAVDQAVLIRGAHRQSVEVMHPALYHTRDTGPHGWVEGLNHWLGREFVDVSSP
ncbi:mannosyl-3-phosphoglycerate phosphatase [Modicisalibacter muralis]|uniref:Mannosyl-3-phosphoglycerate phosphatase n=1 Tax=Modicisalibacter muralis TaxID=119000 RepID=A0A1G9RHM7_9GAMM|nr:mannosyl-3-phosphoglycerate phosphatase [Halomonas muralis]SDM22829.1 mannosyl-3-phosphoglycerate phosphatase [Halomonas muralis]